MKYQFIWEPFTSAYSIRDALFSRQYHQKAIGLNVLPCGLFAGAVPRQGKKRGADSSPCLHGGTGKHPDEAQELEARRTAHPEHLASPIQICRFSMEASMRVSAK
jgi:hypothetical protein